MAKHLLLTGFPGCGKTTLIRRIVDRLQDRRLAGFYTQEVCGPDGRRIGFEAIMLNGGSTTLASVRSKSEIRVGKYGVDLPRFEELILGELQRSDAHADLFIIDEIGKMECCSYHFVQLMVGLLRNETPLVLATVAMKGGGFIREVKERDDVKLVEVTPRNRDDLVAQIVGQFS